MKGPWPPWSDRPSPADLQSATLRPPDPPVTDRVRTLAEIHAEPPMRYEPDRRKGTWQPPVIPPGDVARIRNAADLAKTVLPPALGLLVYRDFVDWCDAPVRFGGHGELLKAAAELEEWAAARALGRPHP